MGRISALPLSAWQIDEVERATNELDEMCLRAAQFVIDNNRLADCGIPPAAVPFIREAWEAEPPAIYRRFDVSTSAITTRARPNCSNTMPTLRRRCSKHP